MLTFHLSQASDDLNLPLGKIRYRAKGSSGGHNGLENIEYWLNTNKYSRLRVGISNPQNKINQVDFVLGLFETSTSTILSFLHSKHLKNTSLFHLHAPIVTSVRGKESWV